MNVSSLQAFVAAAPQIASCAAPSADQVKSLMAQLDAAHQAKFNNLDCETKNLVIQVASQNCKGKNTCKGLNSCAGENNSCAGKGSCAGKTAGPIKDKNKALDLAVEHMAEKRAGLIK